MKPIRFKYSNHRDELHEYVMIPEPNLSFGTCGANGPLGWLISGHVTSRDGVLRPGRRTFLLHKMTCIELVGD